MSTSFTPNDIAAEELLKSKTIPSTPPCGKICSYDWDAREEGTYYPLLHKAVNCPNTLFRMGHSPYPVIRPPPRSPPPDLLNNFTINGRCPVSNFEYRDDTRGQPRIRGYMNYDATSFRELQKLDHVTDINTYKDEGTFKRVLTNYSHLIHEKFVAVIGTQSPWAEAMLLNLGAKSVTTIEYRPLVIEDERVTIITPYDLANQFTGGYAIPFDTVITYSSLEHSGLGRYGDPLTPFGDLEATAEIWCMVKPDGYLILSVPVHINREQCDIVWNNYRYYGDARLQHLTANWRVLEIIDGKDKRFKLHQILVLRKVKDSKTKQI